jgi:hypothetical protein
VFHRVSNFLDEQAVDGLENSRRGVADICGKVYPKFGKIERMF